MKLAAKLKALMDKRLELLESLEGSSEFVETLNSLFI